MIVTSFSKHLRRNILILISIMVSLASNVCVAVETNYMQAVPTKRLALVIANSDYKNAGPIPSAYDDAHHVTNVLRALNFTVIEKNDFKTVDDFYAFPFEDLKAQVSPNDFVLFYYSGHGFNYKGEDYLVPTQYPEEISSNSILLQAVSVRVLRKRIEALGVGFMMFMLDACRSMTGNIRDQATNQTNPISKGFAEPNVDESNVYIAYAAQPGATAYTGPDGRLSPFTDAIVTEAPAQNSDVDAFLHAVRADVVAQTHDTPEPQTPWWLTSSSAVIYFNPSQKLIDGEQEVWSATLATQSPYQIRKFIELYSISRFVAPARQWLAEHPNAPEPSSKIPPAWLDSAWTNGGRVDRIDGPFALGRTTRVIAKAASDTGRSVDKSAFDAAKAIAISGTTVLSASVSAKLTPSEFAAKVSTVPSGTELKVADAFRNEQGQAWLKVELPDDAQPAYLPASRLRIANVDIGIPLREIETSNLPDDLPTLVDPAPIRNTVAELQRLGHVISRVSISAAPGDDSRQNAINEARITDATYVLQQAGIPRQSVTALGGNVSVSKDKIRLRFYGSK